ncbi:TrkA family potassium uptake protein [symbiont of Argiope bruennichi]|uniref:potassium channel family protein n=1 Tax=symbiont of Argiope bruennichi TaxID=2810479 RepID=UPI003DA68C1B
MENDFCIIGVGKFGKSIIEELIKMKKNILALDSRESIINQISAEVDEAYIIDATDKEALMEVGVDRFKTVVVSVGSDIESSILIIAALKEIGIEKIVAKASSERHKDVINALGVHTVVLPEYEVGKKIAYQIIYSFNYYLVPLDKNFCLLKITLNNINLTKKKLSKINFRKNNINIISIKRFSEIINPSSEIELEIGDEIMLITNVFEIETVSQIFEGTKQI